MIKPELLEHLEGFRSPGVVDGRCSATLALFPHGALAVIMYNIQLCVMKRLFHVCTKGFL